MNFVPVKVIEMTPLMLNWAVACAIKGNPEISTLRDVPYITVPWQAANPGEGGLFGPGAFEPVTDYVRGGILIDRYRLCTGYFNDRDLEEMAEGEVDPEMRWFCNSYEETFSTYGPTRLWAAMVNIIVGELGETVGIPEMLIVE